MKKYSSLLCILFLVTSCGSLTITPKGCKTNAVWGANPLSSREITREELLEERELEKRFNESFTVFYDKSVRLKDLLEKNGIKCEDLKKIRVQISTSYFLKRDVQLIVIQNK